MDVHNGHVVSDINMVAEALRANYTPIPKHLEAEAKEALDGRADAYINPNRQKALSAWADKKRRKNRARANLSKASRARNR